jgi:hypothetical protein
VSVEKAPNVSRLCYLVGGLAALNNRGTKVELCVGPGGVVLAEFQTKEFATIFADLESFGTPVVGCQFYQHVDEVRGLSPPSFRVFTPKRGWIARDTGQKWSEIAVSAMKSDDMKLADCAGRIAFEMEAIEYRLLQLSIAYMLQLRRLVLGKELKEYVRFSDLNTNAVVHGVHALFYEIAVLRDYIAEFAAKHVLGVAKGNQSIRAMSGLTRGLQSGQYSDPLVTEILRITDNSDTKPGWLAELSAYRNLFTHVAPMEMMGLKSFAVQEFRIAKDGIRLPAIYHPLPADPIQLQATRGKGFPFARFKDWITASAKHRPTRDTQPDALEYLHSAVTRIADLAETVMQRSSVRPTPIRIGPEDVIGPVRVSYR